VGDKILRHQVTNVLHVPDFNCNLLSLGHLDAAGIRFEGSEGEIQLKEKGKVIGIGKKKQGMYSLNVVGDEPKQAIANAAVDDTASWEEWHRRFGHLAYSGLEKLKKADMVTGLDLEGDAKPTGVCEACVKAKLARRPFPQVTVQTKFTIQGDRTTRWIRELFGNHKVRHDTSRPFTSLLQLIDKIEDFVNLYRERGKLSGKLLFESDITQCNFCAQ